MSDGPSRAPRLGCRLVLPLTRRGRRWLLAGAALGMVVGATLYVLTPPQHRAEAVVEASEVSSAIEVGAGNGGASRVTIDTDAQLLAADEVIAAIATGVGAAGRRRTGIVERYCTAADAHP